MKPFIVATIHRNLCKAAKCNFLDKIDYTDPCTFCPNGHWRPYRIVGCEGRGLGDLVEKIAQPIAKGLDAIFKTKIANCSGCKKRRERLNKIRL